MSKQPRKPPPPPAVDPLLELETARRVKFTARMTAQDEPTPTSAPAAFDPVREAAAEGIWSDGQRRGRPYRPPYSIT